MALAELLCGMAPAEFFSTYYDQKPLVLRGAPDTFMRYYSIADFETRLTESDIRFPQFQLAMHGRKLTALDYTCRRAIGNHIFDGAIDIAAVYGLWSQGATIILNALQNSSPSLIPFLRRLEGELSHPVQANAYLTPQNAQGFDVHYDTHDVFVAQVEGRKHWRIWAVPCNTKPLYHEGSPLNCEPEGPLSLDDTIGAGDVIYIPRGYYHEARAENDVSLHITIGIRTYRRIDALKFLFQHVLAEIEKEGSSVWRDALAPNYFAEGDGTFDHLRDAVVDALTNSWGVGPTITRFREDRRPSNLGLLARGREIEDLSLTTPLRMVDEHQPSVRLGRHQLTVVYMGRLLTLPESAENALLTMIELRRFVPNDLNGYDEQSKLVLCRHLLKQGLLELDVAPDGRY